MATLIDFIEAGFNRALDKLTNTTETGFMALKDKIAELQVAASEERLQATSRFDKLDKEIAQLKELLAGNDSLVKQLTEKIAEKDGAIADLTEQLEASKSEIGESLAAIDAVVADVKAIVADEPAPEPTPEPTPEV